MITRLLILLIALCSGFSSMAHPHNNVAQHVLLSMYPEKTVVKIRIVPSREEGHSVYSHIDADKNGKISTKEAEQFGREVIREATLVVNGRKVAITKPKVTIPSLEKLNRGFGLIEVVSEASLKFEDGVDSKIVFEMAYQKIAHVWFVQPFLSTELIDGRKPESVSRTKQGRKLEMILRSLWAATTAAKAGH